MSEVEVHPAAGRHRLPDSEEATAEGVAPAAVSGPPVLVLSSAPDVAAILQAAPTPLLLLSLEGCVLGSNTAAEELTGRSGSALVGLALTGLLTGGRELVVALDEAAAGGTGAVVTRLVRADGTDRPVQARLARVPDGAGRTTHLVVHLADRTEQTAREARLVHQSLHDPLTGLPHRAVFVDAIHRAVVDAHEHGTSTCVLVLEAVGLAALDAAHGHATGDRAVAELAGRVRQEVRSCDTAAHLDTGVLAVLCEDTTAEQGAIVAARLGAVTSGVAELATSVRVVAVDGASDPAAAFATLVTAVGAPGPARTPRGGPGGRRMAARRR